MADIAAEILQLVANRGTVESLQVAKQLNVDHQKVVGAVKSLQSLGNVSEDRTFCVDLIQFWVVYTGNMTDATHVFLTRCQQMVTA